MWNLLTYYLEGEWFLSFGFTFYKIPLKIYYLMYKITRQCFNTINSFYDVILITGTFLSKGLNVLSLKTGVR